MTRDNYYLKPIAPVTAPTYDYKYLSEPATVEVSSGCDCEGCGTNVHDGEHYGW